MNQPPASRVGVTRLQETHPDTAGRPPDEPALEGYCLITADEQSARVVVWLDRERTLEGDLVWLGPAASEQDEPGVDCIVDDADAEEPAAPDSDGPLVEPDVTVSEPEATPEETEAAPSDTEVTSVEHEATPEPEEGPAARATMSEVEMASIELEADPVEPEAAPGETEVTSAEPEAAPAELEVTSAESPPGATTRLVPQHPQARRASGTAALDITRGSLQLHLRGLPAPTALGKDWRTGRPYNAYFAWLASRDRRTQHPLGVCERAWGENFRLIVDGSLELGLYDSVVVTLADRQARHPDPSGPPVLAGLYRHSMAPLRM